MKSELGFVAKISDLKYKITKISPKRVLADESQAEFEKNIKGYVTAFGKSKFGSHRVSFYSTPSDDPLTAELQSLLLDRKIDDPLHEAASVSGAFGRTEYRPDPMNGLAWQRVLYAPVKAEKPAKKQTAKA
jgi:hypothetical protein